MFWLVVLQCGVCSKDIVTARSMTARRVMSTWNIISAVTVTLITVPRCALSAEAQLGVKDGLLQLCPDSWGFGGCVASQDDRPLYFLPPWEYDGDWSTVKDKIIDYVSLKWSPAKINDQDRYLRFEFVDKDTGRIDDTEFYFTVGDSTVQFRSARRGGGILDFNANRNRIEDIRTGLGLVSIEVLRSRDNVFLESPLDSFGPSTNGFFQRDSSSAKPIQQLNGVQSAATNTFPIWETRVV
jgi:uncharacterized protein (DUF1499 family)